MTARVSKKARKNARVRPGARRVLPARTFEELHAESVKLGLAGVNMGWSHGGADYWAQDGVVFSSESGEVASSTLEAERSSDRSDERGLTTV